MEPGAGRLSPLTLVEPVIDPVVDPGADPAPNPTASPKHDTLAIIGILSLVVAVGLFIAWPWLPQTTPELDEEVRYQPLAHGLASTSVTLDASGSPQAWTTSNLVAIPAWNLFGDTISATILSQLLTLIPELGGDGHFPAATTLYQQQVRSIDASGLVTQSDSYILRRPQGDLLLAFTLPGDAAPWIYDPPMDISVAGASARQSQQSGNLAGVYSYTATISRSVNVVVTSPFGEFRACRRVILDYALSAASGLLGQQTTEGDYCPDIGQVTQTISGNGAAATTSYTLLDLPALDRTQVAKYLPPRQPLSAEANLMPAIDQWTLTTFAQSGHSTSNSIAPTYIATARPLLLAAARSGPLVAFDATQVQSTVWQFVSGASIYSEPAADPATGYLYFGSSDKHAYAVSADGILLWRVAMHDNIAAQPLLAGDNVVFAAEDGKVVALDKWSGAERWQLALGSATFAWPAALSTTDGDLVVVGADDGTLVAMHSATGAVAWQQNLEGAIQAPLIAAGEFLYVGTQAGTLHAIAADGSQQWSTEILSALRTAIAFDDERLYLVDDTGWLYAVTRDDGRILWRSSGPDYLGPPIRVSTVDIAGSTISDLLVVAASDGTISALALDGELLHEWQVATTSGQAQVSVSLGPTFGGGAIWLGDDNALIYRLGAPLTPP